MTVIAFHNLGTRVTSFFYWIVTVVPIQFPFYRVSSPSMPSPTPVCFTLIFQTSFLLVHLLLNFILIRKHLRSIRFEPIRLISVQFTVELHATLYMRLFVWTLTRIRYGLKPPAYRVFHYTILIEKRTKFCCFFSHFDNFLTYRMKLSLRSIGWGFLYVLSVTVVGFFLPVSHLVTVTSDGFSLIRFRPANIYAIAKFNSIQLSFNGF